MLENASIFWIVYRSCFDFSTAIIKYNYQKQLGEEQVYLTFISISQPITQGNQDKNSRQEPGHEDSSRGPGGTLFTDLIP